MKSVGAFDKLEILESLDVELGSLSMVIIEILFARSALVAEAKKVLPRLGAALVGLADRRSIVQNHGESLDLARLFDLLLLLFRDQGLIVIVKETRHRGVQGAVDEGRILVGAHSVVLGLQLVHLDQILLTYVKLRLEILDYFLILVSFELDYRPRSRRRTLWIQGYVGVVVRYHHGRMQIGAIANFRDQGSAHGFGALEVIARRWTTTMK